MPCYCCCKGCKNNNHKSKAKHFFRFPKNDTDRHKVWLKFVKNKGGNVNKTSVICEDHFESRFIKEKGKKVKLSADAVPTIQTNQLDDQIDLDFVQDHDIDDHVVADKPLEQELLSDLSSLCRFCAETKPETIEIVNFKYYNIDCVNFFKSLDLPAYEENHLLPTSVCEECFNQVLAIDTFIVKFKSANSWLLEQMEKQSHQTIIEAEDDIQEEVIEMSQNEGGQFSEMIINDFEIETDSEIIEVSCEEVSTMNSKISMTAFIDPNCNKFALRSYTCDYCHKVFAGLKTFKCHICDIEVQCDVCGNVFNTVFELKSHQKRLHGGNVGKAYCSSCKTVVIGNDSVIKRHREKCNIVEQTEFNCKSCRKTFSTVQSFAVHQTFHKSNQNTKTKTAKIICELCGKTYSTNGDVRRHIKLKHTEITEVYSCDICDKNYPSKSVLKDHIRNTHIIDEVPCSFCGKIFRNKTHLKKHMVYHDESKKVHKCFLCPTQPGFINKAGLVRHEAKHAKQESNRLVYNCGICIGSTFHTMFQLRSHLKNIHGVEQT